MKGNGKAHTCIHSYPYNRMHAMYVWVFFFRYCAASVRVHVYLNVRVCAKDFASSVYTHTCMYLLSLEAGDLACLMCPCHCNNPCKRSLSCFIFHFEPFSQSLVPSFYLFISREYRSYFLCCKAIHSSVFVSCVTLSTISISTLTTTDLIYLTICVLSIKCWSYTSVYSYYHF